MPKIGFRMGCEMFLKGFNSINLELGAPLKKYFFNCIHFI